MDFFESTLCPNGISYRPRPRPVALESSMLGNLPLELILYIARFLPPESASSFSLCCRPIYFTLGTQYLKTLEEDQQLDRYNFLALLERDLPNYISCYYCKKLHGINKAYRHTYYNRRFLGRNRWLTCWKADSEFMTYIYIHERFSFTIFQMTMKLYRQGLDYSKLLNLLSYKTKTNFRHCYVEQRMALARIVAGSLLIREQKIVMIPPTQPIPIPSYPFFPICHHFSIISTKCFHDYNSGNIQIAHWDEPEDYRNWKGMIQCKYCLTEFRVDFKKFGERGTAMFVTKWQDLGQGRSPLDHKWRSHVAGQNPREWLPVEFDRGSICTAFERKEHFMFEFDGLLTLQDKKELFRKSPYEWPENL